jgi:RimJ/RimL family protein N-acetyltransferase
LQIQLLKLTSTDAPRLRAIRLKALADSPSSFGADYVIESEKPINYWENYLRISNWCIVISDGEDIGLLEVSKAANDRNADCWLSGWWIDKSYRGRGISKLMLDWLDQLCLEKGWSKQGLGVWPENEGAIAAYLNLGFIKAPSELPSRSRPDKMYLPMYRNLPL